MKRLGRLCTGFGMSTVTVVMLLGPLWPGQGSVSAATPTECTGGTIPLINRKPCVMYFSGRDISSVYQTQNTNPYQWDVLINGTSGAEQDRFLNPDGSMALNGTQFIAAMEAYLARGDLTHYNSDTAGAVFIIDTMLGQPGTEFGNWQNGYRYAMSHLTDWKQRVMYYDSQGWVKWDANETFGVGTLDSAHECRPLPGSDPHFIDCNGAVQDLDYGDYAFTRNGDEVTTPVIDFHMPGTPDHFRIRRICGNLIGNLSQLQQPAPYNLKPSITPVVPNGASVAAPEETVKFNFYITNVGQNPSPNDIGCNNYFSEHPGQYQPPPGQYDGGTPGNPPPDCGGKVFPANNTAVSVGHADVLITAAEAGHTICETLSVKPANAKGATHEAEACVFVADLPYVAVSGGDVSVGAAMDVGGTCTTDDTKAGVVSWNEENAGNYVGAGTQYAAFALNHLQDFASAQGGGLAPSGLAFANTPSSVQPPDIFGGNFGSLDCMQDYFSGHPRNPTHTGNYNIPANSIGTGTNTIYVTGGNVTINAQAIPDNSQTVVYVDGNVHITGDITFSGSYANVSAIPTFDLIVKGNIYIAPGVGEIDGLYVAEPNVAGGTANDGVTYTCAATPYRTANTSPSDAQTYLTNNLYNQCRTNSQMLTVNGSLVARQVWLLRAVGSIGSNAAEKVNFSPEVWLHTPPATNTGTYDAITSLPPVL